MSFRSLVTLCHYMSIVLYVANLIKYLRKKNTQLFVITVRIENSENDGRNFLVSVVE